jgi:hypothetical protein
VTPAPDLGGDDFATPLADFALEDGIFDLSSTDLYCQGPPAPEVCGNGCDDDKNGYSDGDDPACTPQLLASPFSSTEMFPLSRLLLQPSPHTLVVDSKLQPSSIFATADRSLAPGVAFLALEGAGGWIRRLVLTLDGSMGTYTEFSPPYPIRDVCIFNGELIVVQRAANSILHRFMADGKTEIGDGGVPLPPLGDGTVLATGCTGATDRLVVSVHDLAGMPSKLLVFDKSSWVPIDTKNMPSALVAANIDRCVDIAWTSSGFYGLFMDSSTIPTNPNNDPGANASQLYPIVLDGGCTDLGCEIAAGAPVDALPDGGKLHSIGTFLP